MASEAESGLLCGVKAVEEPLQVLQPCQAASQARNAFARLATVIEVADPETAGQFRRSGQPHYLDDDQVLELRRFVLSDFPKQAAMLRDAAKAVHRHLP